MWYASKGQPIVYRLRSRQLTDLFLLEEVLQHYFCQNRTPSTLVLVHLSKNKRSVSTKEKYNIIAHIIKRII